jgi:uncharacterized phage-associated protein
MTKSKVYDVFSIADAILKIAKAKGHALTPMKLIKLTYIAHGWALAVLDRDLFGNKIEAWQYGPVIPDLYHATKKYGKNEIPLSIVGDSNIISLDQDTVDFLKDVYGKYGNFSAIHLSNLTHQSGTPWDLVYKEGVRRIEIPDDIIRDHYKNLLATSQAA